MKGHWFFFYYETGQGKTALCYSISAAKASLGYISFIINLSIDLTFSDFKKASMSASPLSHNTFLYDPNAKTTLK